MQFRGSFQDFFFETMLPALKARALKAFKAKKVLYNLCLHTDATSRSIEQLSMVTGVGLPVLVGEGEDTPTDTQVQGYNRTFRPAKYGLDRKSTRLNSSHLGISYAV